MRISLQLDNKLFQTGPFTGYPKVTLHNNNDDARLYEMQFNTISGADQE